MQEAQWIRRHEICRRVTGQPRQYLPVPLFMEYASSFCARFALNKCNLDSRKGSFHFLGGSAQQGVTLLQAIAH